MPITTIRLARARAMWVRLIESIDLRSYGVDPRTVIPTKAGIQSVVRAAAPVDVINIFAVPEPRSAYFSLLVVAPRILRSRDIRTSLYSTRKVTKRKHAPDGATASCAPRRWVPRRASIRPCMLSRERASQPAPETGSPQRLAVLEARHRGTRKASGVKCRAVFCRWGPLALGAAFSFADFFWPNKRQMRRERSWARGVPARPSGPKPGRASVQWARAWSLRRVPAPATFARPCAARGRNPAYYNLLLRQGARRALDNKNHNRIPVPTGITAS